MANFSDIYNKQSRAIHSSRNPAKTAQKKVTTEFPRYALQCRAFAYPSTRQRQTQQALGQSLSFCRLASAFLFTLTSQIAYRCLTPIPNYRRRGEFHSDHVSTASNHPGQAQASRRSTCDVSTYDVKLTTSIRRLMKSKIQSSTRAARSDAAAMSTGCTSAARRPPDGLATKATRCL